MPIHLHARREKVFGPCRAVTKSKLRRKPGRKAVTHPGRRESAKAKALDLKMWQTLGEPIEAPPQRDLHRLPLFDHRPTNPRAIEM